MVMPVKTVANGTFRVEARDARIGALLWSAATDYIDPPNPSIYQQQPYNVLLTQQGRLYVPGAGAKLLLRDDADTSDGVFASQVFYGAAAYNADRAAFDGSVFIHTPLTADAEGNIFFGFRVTGPNPAGLVSGIARVSPDGTGVWVGAAAATGDPAVQKPVTNCAPAISIDGTMIYIAVHAITESGYTQAAFLLALDATTLATRAKVALVDPNTLTPARLDDHVTSSPVVGPDGCVFYGVLEVIFDINNARGWLLQFDALLNSTGAPGSFGRDASPSVIPASMVPSYRGTSPYLLATNYNNYLGEGSGDGQNRLAILDPTASQRGSEVPSVMREVLTILAPTQDGNSPTARREWCTNTMAADPFRRSILANNEDGVLYRWDLATNTLAQSVRLTSHVQQAYTPTAVGPDGAVYAVSNGTLFSVRAD
ncbi:MAG: hypothetical protein ACTHMG_15360 [Sphingomonas sp.]